MSDFVVHGLPGSPFMDYGAWATYIYARLSGYELRERTDPGRVMQEIFGTCKDRVDFASFYAAGLDGTAAPRRRARPLPANVGPIKYTGQALIQRDIANFKAALGSQDVADAFMICKPVGSNGWGLAKYPSVSIHAVGSPSICSTSAPRSRGVSWSDALTSTA